MRKTKQQMLNMQAQLEHIGKRIDTFSRLNFNYDKIETLGMEFWPSLADLDIQQVCNRYEWRGLPPYLTGQLIELMLYNKGSLCGFISGGTLYILPYAQAKGINIYGMPNAVQPITYNGAMSGTFEKFGKELLVNNLGSQNTNAQAVILYDKIPMFSQGASPIGRAVLVKDLLEYQCDILGRIKNNLRNIDKKMVFYCESEGQAEQMRNDLREAYGNADPFVVVVRKGASQFGPNSDNGVPLQNGVEEETQSLFETWQSVNSIRCMCAGISNGGAFEKKERKITGELQGDQTQTELVIDSGLKMRRLFLEQLKLIYPQYKKLLDPIQIVINERSMTYEIEDTDPSTDKQPAEVRP